MELQYYGGNCLKITTKKATLVIDDYLNKMGGKSTLKEDDVALFTAGLPDPEPKTKLTLASPGEYEVSGVSVMGIAARGYTDEAGLETAVIFKVLIDDIRLAIVGHINPQLSDEQLEAIGTVDILVIPVGGEGVTLDGADAGKVVREIEPKIIVPTYFADKNIKYQSKVSELSEALKGLGMEAAETAPKLKLKAAELPETAKLIVLEVQ